MVNVLEINTQRELDAPDMVKQPARPSGAQLECRASSCFAARAQLLRLPLFQIVHDVVQQWAD
jgi:hypothetical protein